MGYSATILKDSVSELGNRLTTFEITFPRIVLSEFNTHRAFSRNSASSRAIPVTKQIRKVLEEPFIPERFGINQPGMQSYIFLEDNKHKEAERLWLNARDAAVASAIQLLLGEELFWRHHPTHDCPDDDVDRWLTKINLLEQVAKGELPESLN